jgi:hypothetical protein
MKNRDLLAWAYIPQFFRPLFYWNVTSLPIVETILPTVGTCVMKPPHHYLVDNITDSFPSMWGQFSILPDYAAQLRKYRGAVAANHPGGRISRSDGAMDESRSRCIVAAGAQPPSENTIMTQTPNLAQTNVSADVRALSQAAAELAGRGDFATARLKYKEAESLLLSLPDGDSLKTEAAAWIYAAIGEIDYVTGARDDALQSFKLAIQYPGGWGAPFIHLRLGQLHLDRGDEESAAVDLSRAYRTGGLAVFMQEDAKYLEFLKSRKLV